MRLTILGLAVVLAAVSVAIADDKTKAKGKKPDPAAAEPKPIVEGEAGERLDNRISAMDESLGGFNGSAFVASGDKVLLEKGYGVADAKSGRKILPNAMWDWASVTKQFTAAAVLRLEMKKKLAVGDTLGKLCPDCPKDKAKVTIRQLLNHTSGVQSGFREEWHFDSRSRDALKKLVLGLPMESKPGEKFDYSNSAYGFVAALVEEASGKSWEDYCVDELFRPAGMTDACTIGHKALDLERVPRQERGTKDPFPYGPELTWGYRGCGGVVASAREMWLWDRALRGDKLLGPAQKKELYEPALESYALGWQVRRDAIGPYVEHSGAVGTNVTWYRRYLDADIVIALAMNYRTKEPLPSVVDELAKIVHDAK
jgi:CubicO group peptidase (beta-lactamase class C family)